MEHRVIRPRGGGKTTELLHLAEETGATIVCPDPRYVKDKIVREGFNSDIKVISYFEYLAHSHPHEEFLIDEIDGLLFVLGAQNGDVIGYSLSPED